MGYSREDLPDNESNPRITHPCHKLRPQIVQLRWKDTPLGTSNYPYSRTLTGAVCPPHVETDNVIDIDLYDQETCDKYRWDFIDNWYVATMNQPSVTRIASNTH